MRNVSFKTSHVQYNVGIAIKLELGTTKFIAVLCANLFMNKIDKPTMECFDWHIESIEVNGHLITEYTKIEKFLDFHESMGIEYRKDIQSEVDTVSMEEALAISGLSISKLV
jgi:hypothetical protein